MIMDTRYDSAGDSKILRRLISNIAGRAPPLFLIYKKKISFESLSNEIRELREATENVANVTLVVSALI